MQYIKHKGNSVNKFERNNLVRIYVSIINLHNGFIIRIGHEYRLATHFKYEIFYYLSILR